MPLADYLAGLGFLAITLGSAVGVSLLLARRRLGHLDGAPRLLALGLTAGAALILTGLVPGALGILDRWTAAATALILLAAATRIPAAPATDPDPPPQPIRESGPASWAIAGAAAGALALWSIATAWNRTVLPSIGIDTLTFHLPNVARWIKSGSFWQVDQFTPLLFNGNYPHTGDVVFLAAVLPWSNDAFVALVNPVFVALTALATYAIALELRAPRATAVLAGALIASLPAVILPAYFETMTDAVMLAFFGSGVLFLLRHWRTGRSSDLALAGLGLGLAFGTKWYGVSSVVVVLAVWVAANLIARRPPRQLLRQGAALACLVAVAGGFWMVRNLVESENPLLPVKVELAGVTLWDAPRDVIRDCAGYTIAHYATDTDALADHVLPAWWENYGLAGPLLLVGWLLGLVLAIRVRDWRATTVGAAAGLLAAAYAITPYSAFGPEGEPVGVGANVRYLVPALLLAAALTAWARGRLGRAGIALEVLAAAAVVDGMRRGFEVELHVVAGVAGGLALVAGAVWASALLTARAQPKLVTPLRVALALAAVAGLVAIGHNRQRDFNDDRYLGVDPVLDRIAAEAPENSRIALAGVWTVHGVSPVLPAFGERLDNEVEFAGPTIEGQLREHADRDAWESRVQRYDLLVVGRGGYGDACEIPGEESDDDAWARAAGFPVLARTERLTLYRVQ